MPNEMFRHRSGVALRNAVGAKPTALDMGSSDRQCVAFKLSRRKTWKCVRCIGRWVWTSIHIYGAVDLSNLPPVMDRDKPLRERIALFPYTMIARRHPRIWRNIAHALLLLHRLTGGGPGQPVKAGGIIQRHSAPIGNIAGCSKESCILVIQPTIRSREIHPTDHGTERISDSSTRHGILPEKTRGAYEEGKECNTECNGSHRSSYRTAHDDGFQPPASACFLK